MEPSMLPITPTTHVKLKSFTKKEKKEVMTRKVESRKVF
ncbi:hypothetical protein [Enterococcus phage VPE25]|nr:hypothetical protein [Enterococcus phage VPE25]